jgi:hypothetical protein
MSVPRTTQRDDWYRNRVRDFRDGFKVVAGHSAVAIDVREEDLATASILEPTRPFHGSVLRSSATTIGEHTNAAPELLSVLNRAHDGL